MDGGVDLYIGGVVVDVVVYCGIDVGVVGVGVLF